MSSSSSDSLQSPRLSVAALGVLAGIGALWVYTAMRRRRQEEEAAEAAAAAGGSSRARPGALRRARTIRRPRRRQQQQASVAAAAAAGSGSSGSSSSSSGGDSGDSDNADDAAEGGYAEEGEGASAAAAADMRMLQVLCTVAEDQARRSAVVHRGTACSSCQESPIRGARFRCAQCADVDVCERCEAHDAHRHHALLKMSVAAPPLATVRAPLLRTAFGRGGGAAGDVPRDATHRALERLLGRGELASLYASFCAIVGGSGGGGGSDGRAMTRGEFLACLGPFAGSLLGSRLFAFYDADGDGVLEFAELARGVALCARSAVAEKAPAVFRAYDVDGDGRVGRDDVRRVLESCAEVNRELTRAAVRALEDDVVEDPAKLLAGQPVSAAFSAAIPPPPPPPDSDAPLPSSPKDAAAAAAPLPSSPKNTAAGAPLTVWHDATEDDAWPAMDALSCDAVRMMLDDIFADAAPADPDFLTYDEFLRYLRRNPSLSIYLEVLGPIF